MKRRHTNSYNVHRTTVKFTKKTARGKTYYYREENGVRTKASKADYLKFRGQNTKLVDKKGNVKNAKLLARLEKKYGKAKVAKAISEVLRTPGETATYKHISAVLEPNRVAKMMINAGKDIEAEAAYLGTSVETLKNPDNWKDGVFTDPESGKSWEFHFTTNYDSTEASWDEVRADE